MAKYKVIGKTSIPLIGGMRAYHNNIISKDEMTDDIFKAFEKHLEAVDKKKSEQPVKSGNSKSDNSKSELFNKGK